MKCKGDQSGRFVHGFRGQTALAQLTASALFLQKWLLCDTGVRNHHQQWGC